MAKVTLKGAQLNYQLLSPHPAEIRASAPCAVYLHGLIMDNLSSAYFTFAQALKGQHTLLMYDLRGHGKSELTPSGYSVEDHAQELSRLLEALDLSGPLHLIGCSFGATIAMEYTSRHPERVASLVFIDGHPHSSVFLRQLGADLSAPLAAQRALIAQHFKHWFSRDIPRKRDRLAHRAQALIHETTLVDDLRASAAQSDSLLAPSLPPTLALYGAESDALPLAQRALGHLREVTWRLFPGRSHALLWEETQAVSDALSAWLNERAMDAHR